jgi:hypothetical protein
MTVSPFFAGIIPESPLAAFVHQSAQYRVPIRISNEGISETPGNRQVLTLEAVSVIRT